MNRYRFTSDLQMPVRDYLNVAVGQKWRNGSEIVEVKKIYGPKDGELVRLEGGKFNYDMNISDLPIHYTRHE